MAFLTLYLDTANNQLIKSLTSSAPVSIPDLFQYQGLPLKIIPVKPTGAAINQFAYAGQAGTTLGVYLGPREGVVTPPAYIVLTAALNDGDSFYSYRGVLQLNTVAMNSLIGSNPTISTFVEMWLFDGTSPGQTLYQAAITIKSTTYDPTGATPAPVIGEIYLTLRQAEAIFAKWANNLPGLVLQVKSPDGAKTREIGIDNDGNPIDNIY